MTTKKSARERLGRSPTGRRLFRCMCGEPSLTRGGHKVCKALRAYEAELPLFAWAYRQTTEPTNG
jgi:hypothetical protein